MGLKIPDLDNKTFADLVEEGRLLIPKYAPRWTDHNLHDPGITFIDLFAHLSEMQIYQLNRLTVNHYMKFLKLVGMSPFPALPAKVNITCNNVTSEITINKNTRFVTKRDGRGTVFVSRGTHTLLPVTLKKVLTLEGAQIFDNMEANERDHTCFFPFAEKAQPGTEFRLGFAEALQSYPDRKIRLFFDLMWNNTPLYPSVNLTWEYLYDGKWHPFEPGHIEDNTLAFNRSGDVMFTVPRPMDKKDSYYWIRCRLLQGKYEVIPEIKRVRLNTIPALQIEKVEKENLGKGNGRPHQVVELENKYVIEGSLVVEVKGQTKQEDSKKDDCKNEWPEWGKVEHFEDSGPDDRHYMYDPATGEITFGNGINGSIPESKTPIRATYETTSGEKGNLDKGGTFFIQEPGCDGIVGKNPENAAGGRDAETLKDTILRAKKDLRTPYRAVTSADYEYLALDTPGLNILRAKAFIPGFAPGKRCETGPAVTVVVVPDPGRGTNVPTAGKGFLYTICEHLNRSRLLTIPVKVAAAEFVKICIACKIHVKKKSSPREVENRVKEALADFLDPLRGGPDKKGWPFGRSVYPSEIYQVLDRVEGVDYAAEVSIQAAGNFTREQNVIRVNPKTLVYPGSHKVEII